MSFGIIVKDYAHVNKSFGNWDTPNGKIVKNKDHYDRLMKEGGYIPSDQAEDINKNRKMKEYVPSERAKRIIHEALSRKGRDGKIKLSGHLKGCMKEIGAYQEIPSYMSLPQHYKNK